MDRVVKKRFLIIYVIIGVLILLTDLLDLNVTRSLSRPLISGALLFFYASISGLYKDDRKRKLLLASLFFAIAGDIAFIFRDEGESFFMSGVAFYFFSLMSYLVIFCINILDSRPWEQHWSQFALALLFLVIGVEFYVETYKSYELFRTPILVFLILLTLLMSATALRAKRSDLIGYIMAIAGSVSFFISNGVIQLDHFVTEIPYAGSVVLVTYITGQYQIVDSVWRSISKLSPQVT